VTRRIPNLETSNVKTYAEHIASLEATRAEKQTRMKAIHQGAVDADRTMDTAESEEFDRLDTEIKAIDVDLARTKKLEAIDKATVAPVNPPPNTQQPVNPTQLQGQNFSLKTVEKLEPGIAFARYAMCLTHAKGDHSKAFKLAERYYPQTESIVQTLKAQSEGANLQELMKLRSSVPAGTTTDSTWASPLVYAQNFGGDFIEYLRPRTLIGQAQFRPVPFNVRIGGQTSGGSANWVGQGKAKPVTKFDFTATTIPFTKVAAIAVITQELARFSDPSAEALVRDSLADCVIAKIDNDLFDPDAAAVANVSPAGLLNGVAPTAGPGNSDDIDGIRCAILRLWSPWDSTNLGMRPAYYTTPAVARYLSFLTDALGNPAFPGVTPTGGSYKGVPIRASNYLANNGGSGGAPFILVDEAEVYLADDGSVTVDASEQATIEMTDAPTGAAGVPTAASVNMVNMWQSNSIALRAERFIWWGLRRSGAVQWIDGFPTSC
jgi:HK97 family phage major capsid protein